MTHEVWPDPLQDPIPEGRPLEEAKIYNQAQDDFNATYADLRDEWRRREDLSPEMVAFLDSLDKPEITEETHATPEPEQTEVAEPTVAAESDSEPQAVEAASEPESAPAADKENDDADSDKDRTQELQQVPAAAAPAPVSAQEADVRVTKALEQLLPVIPTLSTVDNPMPRLPVAATEAPAPVQPTRAELLADIQEESAEIRAAFLERETANNGKHTLKELLAAYGKEDQMDFDEELADHLRHLALTPAEDRNAASMYAIMLGQKRGSVMMPRALANDAELMHHAADFEIYTAESVNIVLRTRNELPRAFGDSKALEEIIELMSYHALDMLGSVDPMQSFDGVNELMHTTSLLATATERLPDFDPRFAGIRRLYTRLCKYAGVVDMVIPSGPVWTEAEQYTARSIRAALGSVERAMAIAASKRKISLPARDTEPELASV
ncbi:MAG TPA: hypothetical protein VLF91_01420 [Candidatus Saccharimonadales bacterium]|nr:hypothetical protein [Candidatus Saccharimonadales bacterium]